MYVKIQPKFDDASEMASFGYMLMTDAFNNLVFAGNLAGYSPGGSYCVIQIGGLFEGDSLDMVREAIMEIWRNVTCHYQPDDLLQLSIVDSILG